MLEVNRIIHGDSLEKLKKIPENSIDSIVTDPPYELGFMGKSWDSTGIAYNVDLWKECLRVLKPGGHLLSFGGTRTYHRMACAIEDAGFEIRDQIQWLYGSGFPKSHNISKALDKKFGAEREVVGRYTHPTAKNGSRTGSKSPFQASDSPLDGSYEITAPSTDLAKLYDGWGTALKPANEPIVMARKPLSEKTIVNNVMEWGTGGINIDESRVHSDEKLVRPSVSRLDNNVYGKGLGAGEQLEPTGRFPANVILDEVAGELLDEQGGTSKRVKTKEEKQTHDGDSSGASRFFYCAKAAKSEKGRFNNHPTVKPIKLMEYLVGLVTPKNGIVLDPFSGSGSTLVAAQNKGFNYIGIEMDEEYIEVANRRTEEYKINK